MAYGCYGSNKVMTDEEISAAARNTGAWWRAKENAPKAMDLPDDFDVECYNGVIRKQRDLKAAFSLVVKDMSDWKTAISVNFPEAEVDQTLIGDAIMHFTGGHAWFRRYGKKGVLGTIKVKAYGYYRTAGK